MIGNIFFVFVFESILILKHTRHCKKKYFLIFLGLMPRVRVSLRSRVRNMTRVRVRVTFKGKSRAGVRAM